MQGQKIVRTPDGVEHRFPAEATDEQIDEALNGPKDKPASGGKRFGSAVASEFNPMNVIRGLSQAALHPLDTARGILGNMNREAGRAVEHGVRAVLPGSATADQRIGEGMNAVIHGMRMVPNLQPIIDPMMKGSEFGRNVSRATEGPDVASAMGHAVSQGAQLAIPGAVEKAGLATGLKKAGNVAGRTAMGTGDVAAVEAMQSRGMGRLTPTANASLEAERDATRASQLQRNPRGQITGRANTGPSPLQPALDVHTTALDAARAPRGLSKSIQRILPEAIGGGALAAGHPYVGAAITAAGELARPVPLSVIGQGLYSGGKNAKTLADAIRVALLAKLQGER